MNTSVIISLGVTLVFCTLIYFFLRKRIDGVDKKVNLLMQLVKEHHDQVQQQSQIIMREKVEQPVYDNLISVSNMNAKIISFINFETPSSKLLCIDVISFNSILPSLFNCHTIL
jgi:hypothetical protein